MKTSTTPKKRKKTTAKKKLTKKLAVKKVARKVVKRVLKGKVLRKKSGTPKRKLKKGLSLKRSVQNPILSPTPYSWESNGTFNPAAVVLGGRVHLFYRALGPEGISRIGYASSKDGVNFDIRLTHPVFVAQSYNEALKHWPYTSPVRPTFDPNLYFSGGGWGGCEDPRAVAIEGIVYLTFNMLNGWAMSVAVSAIKEQDLLNKKWNWSSLAYLSNPSGRQKNWVLFPEKMGGKFVLLYNLDKGDPSRVHVKYMDELNISHAPREDETLDPQLIPDHDVAWHFRTRSAAAPPIKTPDGWLLLYHAMERSDSSRYKVGAMLLDLKDPEKILYRAPSPILEPDYWYENDYKPGIVYASGAVIKDGKLFVYYGGGDKYIGLATVRLEELLKDLKQNKPVKMKKEKLFKPE
jgi:predicted GH43/DUF377 family glycosyl hydrolase